MSVFKNDLLKQLKNNKPITLGTQTNPNNTLNIKKISLNLNSNHLVTSANELKTLRYENGKDKIQSLISKYKKNRSCDYNSTIDSNNSLKLNYIDYTILPYHKENIDNIKTISKPITNSIYCLKKKDKKLDLFTFPLLFMNSKSNKKSNVNKINSKTTCNNTSINFNLNSLPQVSQKPKSIKYFVPKNAINCKKVIKVSYYTCLDNPDSTFPLTKLKNKLTNKTINYNL